MVYSDPNVPSMQQVIYPTLYPKPIKRLIKIFDLIQNIQDNIIFANVKKKQIINTTS